MDEKLTQLSEKLELLEEKCILLQDREKRLEELYCLHENVAGVKETVAECRKAVSEHLEPIKKKYNEVLRKSRYVQLSMLYLLEHLPDDKPAVQEPGQMSSAVVPSSKLPKHVETPNEGRGAIPKPQIEDTPHRMSVEVYGKSPFANRKKPVKLEFLDFEAEITHQDFAKIPP